MKAIAGPDEGWRRLRGLRALRVSCGLFSVHRGSGAYLVERTLLEYAYSVHGGSAAASVRDGQRADVAEGGRALAAADVLASAERLAGR